ncbi:monooxygenase [Roseovarius spongiae]|uniref:Monooxygenase n=1 Tax=Roseovarius spongiae TaxID=2320272 RepID=A0A3A8B3E1_9RHOB|nr:FAD-dependent monooxygenase [Roseovarius spongiae]RKF15112.1 monooxygenase [Roseovarius spongiae]
MDMNALDIAVIGGGIGGLAVARACALRGAAVTLYEQAAKIAEVGAGLQISPNGFVVLEALGLGHAVRAAGVRAEAVALHDHRGARVLRLDLGRLERRDYWFLHRADLIDILHRGAIQAGVRIRLGAKVSEAGPGPFLRLGDEETRPDLVIAADGLHSVLRAALEGGAAPFFTGQVAWRAVVPGDPGQPAEARVHMGPRRHVVSYPLRGGRLTNIVAVEERAEWTPESWSHAGDADELRARFAGIGGEARALLDAVGEVRQWGLFRHPVAQVWGRDGAALLGDAAHPTLPFMAQGANLALEDAWVLAAALGKAPDMAAALETYQSRRASRARRVVEAASRNAWKYHLATPPLRVAAHAALRLGGALAPGRMLRQFDWIYGHDVTAAKAFE